MPGTPDDPSRYVFVFPDQHFGLSSYLKTIAHEIGHTLGLPHTPGIDGINLMEESGMDWNALRKPQWDVKGHLKVYQKRA
jgi:hypothetical protein